jgi:putative SOS response-associated peptidase YedK
MCGRYASSRRPEDLIDEFEVTSSRFAAPLEADFNVAPTKEVYAVVERPRAKDEPVERQLRVVKWGLVPSWAKEASIGSRLINARMETVAEKPAFKRAFAVRRCLLPADGYYEWYETSELTRAGKPKKQPFYIHPADGGVLAMAGLYEIWKDPAKGPDDPELFRWTCTVITTDATDDLGRIHDRMPLMVAPDHRAAWLDPASRDPRELLDLLEPAMPGRLEAFPVSTAVGNVQNNGPELIEPLPVQAG